MPTKNENGDYVIFTDLEEGNSMAIMATVVDMLRQIYGEDSQDYIDEYREKAMSGGYENLKKVSMETVPIITFGDSSDYKVVAHKKEVEND